LFFKLKDIALPTSYAGDWGLLAFNNLYDSKSLCTIEIDGISIDVRLDNGMNIDWDAATGRIKREFGRLLATRFREDCGTRKPKENEKWGKGHAVLIPVLRVGRTELTYSWRSAAVSPETNSITR
jgi:hypothetical protein